MTNKKYIVSVPEFEMEAIHGFIFIHSGLKNLEKIQVNDFFLWRNNDNYKYIGFIKDLNNIEIALDSNLNNLGVSCDIIFHNPFENPENNLMYRDEKEFLEIESKLEDYAKKYQCEYLRLSPQLKNEESKTFTEIIRELIQNIYFA